MYCKVKYDGHTSKTLFKVVVLGLPNDNLETLVEVDPIKNKKDNYYIKGWLPGNMLSPEAIKRYNIDRKKLYWWVNEVISPKTLENE